MILLQIPTLCYAMISAAAAVTAKLSVLYFFIYYTTFHFIATCKLFHLLGAKRMT